MVFIKPLREVVFRFVLVDYRSYFRGCMIYVYVYEYVYCFRSRCKLASQF
jgi:hypothetical protein